MDEVRETLFLPDDAPVDGSGVRIAVLDTGIDPDHPDLQHTVSSESRNFCPLASDVADRAGHGTHIAGIIAGNGRASGGRYRGIAPAAEIIALKVSADGGGYSDTLAAGVLHAIELGADIINYSGGQDAGMHPPWKWSRRPNLRDEAFQRACDAGLLCVSAAGNHGPHPGSIIKPGLWRDVLCVGAVTTDGEELAEGSSRGPVYLDSDLPKNAVERASPNYGDEPAEWTKPDLVAPGGEFGGKSEPWRIARRLSYPIGPVSCRSSLTERLPGLDPSDPDSPYTRISGTSQATAVITGLAALAIEYGRTLGIDWDQNGNAGQALRNLLLASATALTGCSQDEVGDGLVIWPSLAGRVEDVVDSETFQRTIFDGPQIELVD